MVFDVIVVEDGAAVGVKYRRNKDGAGEKQTAGARRVAANAASPQRRGSTPRGRGGQSNNGSYDWVVPDRGSVSVSAWFEFPPRAVTLIKDRRIPQTRSPRLNELVVPRL